MQLDIRPVRKEDFDMRLTAVLALRSPGLRFAAARMSFGIVVWPLLVTVANAISDSTGSYDW
jgi:hypothetical protein